jgi:Zinc-finger of C2H2 type/C2H2-type zinc finger
MSDPPRPTFKCFCGRTYSDEIDLEEHRRARGHFSVHVCGPRCNHPRCSQGPIRIQFCNYCGKKCERDDILKDHCTFTGHCFCPKCDHIFPSQEALEGHLRTKIHATEFRCCDCSIEFNGIRALNVHMASAVHRKPLPAKRKEPKPLKATITDDSLSCEDCERTFNSTTALSQHLASVKHKPLSNLPCPLGKKCTMRFLSPSALIQHLESGECDSGTTRETLYSLIQTHDSERLIHSPPESAPLTPQSYPPSEVSLTNHLLSIPNGSDWSLIIAPSIHSPDESMTEWSFVSGLQTPISDDHHSIDTPAPNQFQCPLCPKRRKPFATIQSLNQHMASPVHCPKIYHCPTMIFSEAPSSKSQKPQKLFSTLGGLAQHLESGACEGGKETFVKIVAFIERRLEILGFNSTSLLLEGYRG